VEYTIMNLIRRIRNNEEMTLIKQNSNPYRIISEEKAGVTAYYFPYSVYKETDSRLLNSFSDKLSQMFDGINVKVILAQTSVCISTFVGNIFIYGIYNSLENIKAGKDSSFMNKKYYEIQSDRIYPSINGFYYKSNTMKQIKIELPCDFFVKDNKNCIVIYVNNKPFLVINTLVVFPGQNERQQGKIFNYKQDGNSLFITTDLSFTFDIYLNKIIFDTTIETADKEKNNAFGSFAFIGNGERFGKQVLYSRFDNSSFYDLNFFEVIKAELFIPIFYYGKSGIIIKKLVESWCSIGVNWNNNKNETAVPLGRLNSFDEFFFVADLTTYIQELFANPAASNAGFMLESEGNYSVIATGDNMLVPQILQLKLRRR